MTDLYAASCSCSLVVLHLNQSQNVHKCIYKFKVVQEMNRLSRCSQSQMLNSPCFSVIKGEFQRASLDLCEVVNLNIIVDEGKGMTWTKEVCHAQETITELQSQWQLRTRTQKHICAYLVSFIKLKLILDNTCCARSHVTHQRFAVRVTQDMTSCLAMAVGGGRKRPSGCLAANI